MRNNENNHSDKTIKQQLILLLGRKVIMLIVSIIAGAILYVLYDVDVWYIVGLYSAFVGGNSMERVSSRINRNNGGD